MNMQFRGCSTPSSAQVADYIALASTMFMAEFSAVSLLGRCHAGVALGSVEEVLRKPTGSVGEVLGRPAGSFGYESGSRVVREWYE